MATRVRPATLKGTRDFLPERMIVRQWVIGVIRQIFERYGFDPLETPALELAETLRGKYGEEADQLVYYFVDRGGRELGLRYDLTVPMARVVAMYPDLPRPFKRYQMQPVWRADRPRKGRYREFWQCDVDTVGSSSMLADAEIVAIIYEVLARLGFRQFRIRINDRKLLNGLAQYAGVAPADAPDVFRAIDKLDKIGLAGVRRELLTRIPPELQAARTLAAAEKPTAPERVPFLDEATADRILELIAVRGSADETLADLRARMGTVPAAAEGIAELEELVGYLRDLDVPADCYQIDLSLARGLEYYTGPIFETEVEQEVAEGRIGSVTGGGRYDNLIGLFTERSLPATGTTIGLERIIDVMEELGQIPPEVRRTVSVVLVTVFSRDLMGESLRLVRELRLAGLNAEVALSADSLGAQLRYADRKGIPLAAILGPEEVASDNVVLRDLRDGTQESVPRLLLAERIRARLEASGDGRR